MSSWSRAGALLLPLTFITAAHAAEPAPAPAAQKPTTPAAGGSMVTAVITTSMGVIELELDKAKAPATVENFVKYAQSGHYTKTVFHRIIKGFMIQGGGMDDKLNKKPTLAPVKNESANGLKNLRGTIAMARTSDPDSATCQFFINHVDNAMLDGAPGKAGYSVFGKVTKGLDVVDKIAGVATGFQGGMKDVPVTPVYIESVTVK